MRKTRKSRVRRQIDNQGYVVTRWNIDRALSDGLPLGNIIESAYSNEIHQPRQDNIVTPKSGKYKGIHFLVRGFGYDDDDPKHEDFKVQIFGKTPDGWKHLWISQAKVKYIGRMPNKAENRFIQRIPDEVYSNIEEVKW